MLQYHGVYMKNWFKNLNDKHKKILANSLLFTGLLLFIVAAISSYYIIILSLLFLIPGIIFCSWLEKDNKTSNSQINEKANAIGKTTTETQKYFEGNEYDNDDFKKTDKQSVKEQPISKKDSYEYTPPDGYEVVDWTYSTTKVRGCQYYIDEDFEIDEDAKVEIFHEPTEKYPENTIVYVDDQQVGTLKQDMATEWYLKYGKNYRFEGNVVEYEPGEYPYLLIEIKKPILRKIKKYSKTN